MRKKNYDFETGQVNKNNHNTVKICTNPLYYMLNGLKDAINFI